MNLEQTGTVKTETNSLSPGPEGVPGIPLASSKGEWALESPHFLGTLVAVSVSGLTGPPTSDLRILLLLAYQAWNLRHYVAFWEFLDYGAAANSGFSLDFRMPTLYRILGEV